MDNVKVAAISVPYPDAPEVHLRLAVGACKFKMHPGDGAALVVGSYRDPSGHLEAAAPDGGSRNRC